jgi:RHH-type rel operon transcriptional repressor/antitoxin RelB
VATAQRTASRRWSTPALVTDSFDLSSLGSCFGAGCVNIVYMSRGVLLGRPVSVRLPEALRERVEALAVATRRSRGDVLREAMEREVDQLEWEYRVAERAADVRAGRVRTVTLSELNAELGETGPVDMSLLDEIE